MILLEFLKPCLLSKNLSSFCDIEYGTKLSRFDVTKKICNYIKKNNLQNPIDQGEILPDNKLAKAISYVKDKDAIFNYLGLQNLLLSHIEPYGNEFKKNLLLLYIKTGHEIKFRFVLFDITRRIHRKDYRIVMNDLKYTPLFGEGYYIAKLSFYRREKMGCL